MLRCHAGFMRAVLLAIGLISASALPAPTHDARGLAAACAACHGTNGVSIGGPRSLAGTPRDDLAKALRAFKSGERGGTVMPELARGYDDAEIDALAAWFAAQGPAR